MTDQPPVVRERLMWIVAHPDGALCYMRPEWTRAKAIAEVSIDGNEWRRLRRLGFRAVRVRIERVIRHD